MRNLFMALTLLLGGGAAAAGQAVPLPMTAPLAGPGWAHVQTIAPGSLLRVTALVGIQFSRMRTIECKLASVDANGLTCARGTQAFTFSVSEIKQIQTNHRLAAGAIGAGVGVGFGISTEYLTAHAAGFNRSKGSVIAASAGAGAILLAPVGYLLGWHTIYRVK